ncbi:MAG: hypothetical protein IT445_14375 [Phycisphaeraceae bacterium]|nr:hypothetical protein [Phycisphaeraceae bacterium]
MSCVCSQAQIADKSRLIDALARENMTELLQRLIETDPPADPVEKARVEIAQLRLRYNDATLTESQRQEAYLGLLDATRNLIASQPEHPQCPLWRTDLAAELLGEFLPVLHTHADLFFEFGIPTAEQKRACQSAVTEAFEQAVAADRRFYEQSKDLMRQTMPAPDSDDGGLQQIENDNYRLKRTPFYLAQAAYLVSLLDDQAPYFAQLGHNASVIDQAATPDDERQRLRALTLHVLDQSGLQNDPTAADAALTLIGRTHLHQGDLAGAQRDFERVLAEGGDDLTHLTAQLGRIAVTAKTTGLEAAAGLLEQLRQQPYVSDNLLYRLLTVDLEHRLLLTAPGNVTESGYELDAAYQPYFTLLADRTLGERVEALRAYIYQRWAQSENVPNVPLVRMAVGQVLREQGQAALQTEGQQNREQAITVLDRAINLNRALTGEALPNLVQATAAYNLGMAMYLRAEGQAQTLLDAAQVLLHCADRFPDQPIAEQAIAAGMAMLRWLDQQDPPPPGVDEAYRAGAQVLFDRYPSSQAADDERVYYAYRVLQRDGENQKAVEFYRKVPPSHETYFDARREMLFAMESYEDADPLLTAARQVRDEAQRDASEPAMRAAAAARLVSANALHAKGDRDGALEQLADFEKDYAGQDDLVSMALERRIVILAAPAPGSSTDPGSEPDSASPAKLADAAGAMMQRYPDDAAAVIDRVLSRIDEQIDLQRLIADDPKEITAQREAARTRIDSLARTAEALADLLVRWAWQQNFQPQQLVPYELIQVKVLLLSGQADRAAEVMQPMIQQYGDSLQVLHYAGETWFARGDEASLIEAAGYYDRIIAGSQPPYPDEYWSAWVRRLQINDKLNQYVDQIPATVRRLQAQDANLGGPRYREQLMSLSRKHGG